MSKIGFLGGTFNPIHNGHLSLAKSAYRQLKLDKVLVIPSGVSYFKANENVLNKDVRADMVRLALKDCPYFEFSDIELKREGNTYTFETLLELKKLYPEDEIYFICGADTVFSIETWKNPDIVFENCTLSCMVRDDSDLDDIMLKCNQLKDIYNAKTVILNADKIDISSTFIRKCFHNGCYEAVKGMLPDGVYDYILDNRLYIN